MRPANGKRGSAGFTLLEVILAFAVFALLMTSGYGALSGILKAKLLLDDRRDEQAIADAVLTRLTRELQLAYYASKLPLIPEADFPENGSPPSIFLKGSSEQLPNGFPGDSLSFLALEGGQYLPDGGAHSGLVQLTYRVVPDPEQERSHDSTYVLVREELPYLNPRKRAYDRAMIFPITKSLVSLSFRYWDEEDNQWVDEWNDRSHGPMPGKIQFSLRLMSPKGRISEYTSAVPIRSINQ